MPLLANITVTAIRHRPVVQIVCVERSVIIVDMIPSAVQENAARTMANARQDVRIASVNALGLGRLGRPVVLMVFHAEKCATIVPRITNAELEDAVPRMTQCSDGVCRESCSCKTDNDCGINECCDSDGVCKMNCKRFSVVMKVIFPLGSTLAGFLLLTCCYCLYKHCSSKQHRNRTVQPANRMSTTHHSTMIINYQQRDNSDSLTIVEVMQLQRSA